MPDIKNQGLPMCHLVTEETYTYLYSKGNPNPQSKIYEPYILFYWGGGGLYNNKTESILLPNY